MTPKQANTKSKRIEVVDSLRGFAVMAIILVHNLEHFIFPVYPTHVPDWLNLLDQGIFNTVFTLFAGKSYAIFALLFGFTFYIQSENQRQRGKDFGYRFLWRLLLLLGFAMLNAAFFPAGDVLLLFVVVGLILFLTRNWSDKFILWGALLFLLQPLEWIHYIRNWLNPSYTLPNLNVDALYAAVAEYTKIGDFWNFVWGNITLGQKASLLWAVSGGRFIQTAGLFLMGFYLGRKQLFVPTPKSLKFWTQTLILSAIAFAPLYTLKELVMDNNSIIQETAGTAMDMWKNLAFTAVLVSSFMLLYQYKRFRNKVRSLRFYGKMSLTNYITQSMIGAFIYLPFGLYLAPYCGYTISLLIGITIFILQLQFCKWWLHRFKQGPLGYIWHKWTWIGTDR